MDGSAAGEGMQKGSVNPVKLMDFGALRRRGRWSPTWHLPCSFRELVSGEPVHAAVRRKGDLAAGSGEAAPVEHPAEGDEERAGEVDEWRTQRTT